MENSEIFDEYIKPYIDDIPEEDYFFESTRDSVRDDIESVFEYEYEENNEKIECDDIEDLVDMTMKYINDSKVDVINSIVSELESKIRDDIKWFGGYLDDNIIYLLLTNLASEWKTNS